ncbi:hypothetical protein PAHAL_4G142900 [Panicum hallii]|uniref:Uncharacterized protein n=1 Tax=Panicum hallii TaxID=206008 RepID=A0A2S3HJ88_9POAL|nr:hypothetical protein PAHAL_4G142900 [Panicum hallii]
MLYSLEVENLQLRHPPKQPAQTTIQVARSSPPPAPEYALARWTSWRTLFPRSNAASTKRTARRKTSIDFSLKRKPGTTTHAGDLTGGTAIAIYTSRHSTRSPSSPVSQRPPEGRGSRRDWRRRRYALLSSPFNSRRRVERKRGDAALFAGAARWDL